MTHAEPQASIDKSAGHREADKEDADDTRSLLIADGDDESSRASATWYRGCKQDIARVAPAALTKSDRQPLSSHQQR
jgi:hypothetical protein